MVYLGICFVGILLRAIGGTMGNFPVLILGRVFEGYSFSINLVGPGMRSH